MKKVLVVLAVLMLSQVLVYANESNNSGKNKEDIGYRIDQPGTITFTVGIKIKGKVEKPQVVIFLPKEKTVYREIDVNFSFKKDIAKSLPFFPIVE